MLPPWSWLFSIKSMPWSISSYTTTIAVSNGNNFVFVSEWNKLRYSRQKQSFPRRNFIFFFFFIAHDVIPPSSRLYSFTADCYIKNLHWEPFWKGKTHQGLSQIQISSGPHFTVLSQTQTPKWDFLIMCPHMTWRIHTCCPSQSRAAVS